MKLFHRKFGKGAPFIILHGLYGSSDNWVSIGRILSKHFEVWLLDLRNHGKSPHSQEHTYDLMVADLLEFMNDNRLEKSIIMGHSMGGKTAMNFAYLHPEKVTHLIVVDIAPKSYLFSKEIQSETLNHKKIIENMLQFDFSGITHREQLDELFSKSFKNQQIRQFLLKNVKRNIDNSFNWIINIQALYSNLIEVLDGFTIKKINLGDSITGFPVLFIKGENSDYITADDKDSIARIFPYADFVSIPEAGHWLHAEQPELLVKAIYNFFDLD